MIIFSYWFVDYLLNGYEIEKEEHYLGGQREVRLLHRMQLISVTENVCTVTVHFCHRGFHQVTTFS